MSSRVHESQLFRACTDTGQSTVVMLIVFPLSVRTLSVHRHEVFTFYARGLFTHEHQPGQRQSGLKKTKQTTISGNVSLLKGPQGQETCINLVHVTLM